MIICSFVIWFWASVLSFVYLISTSLIFMHAELCGDFTMLEFIVEMVGSRKGIVAIVEFGV